MPNWLEVSATILTTAFLIYYLLLKWKYSYWNRKGVAQLPTEKFYGNHKHLIQGVKATADVYEEFYEKFKKMGVPYGGIYSLLEPVWVVIDPKMIKTVLVTDFAHFTAHVFHLPGASTCKAFTENLFVLHGDAWKNLRKKVTPTFTTGKIKMMFEIMVLNGARFKKVIDEMEASSQPVNIREVLNRYTTDNIASCAFGVDANTLENPECEFAHYSKLFTRKSTKPPLVEVLLRHIGIRKREGIYDLQAFFAKIVRNTIAYREANNVHKKDLMHLMIQLKNKGTISEDASFQTTEDMEEFRFTEEEIVAQCVLFFLAGFETSSTSVTFALLELAQDEELQSKAREEIEEVLGKYDGELTYDAINEMRYLEAVLDESLRMYPPLPVLPRYCTRDYKIPGTNTIIEKGTSVALPIIGLQRDPEYFPEPKRFNPDRFLGPNKVNKADFTYLPFGEGPRICLGLRFGLIQTKIAMISLLKDYKVSISEKTKLPITLQSTPGLISVIDSDLWLDVAKI